MNEHGEKTPLVIYYGAYYDNPVYYRVCPKCGRYVIADDMTRIPEYQGNEPNATCKKCGRVQMEFCCWKSELCEVNE